MSPSSCVGLDAVQRAHVDEAGARLAESLRRAAGAEAIDRHAVLPDPHRQRHEVAVRRHDPEPVDPPAEQQVHRVDRHLHVGRVLALGQVELLLRLDPVLQAHVLPALQRRLGPIAVHPPHVDRAQLGQDRQHRVERRRDALSASIRSATLRFVSSVTGVLPLVFARIAANSLPMRHSRPDPRVRELAAHVAEQIDVLRRAGKVPVGADQSSHSLW